MFDMPFIRWVIASTLLAVGVISTSADEPLLLRLHLTTYETYNYSCTIVMQVASRYQRSEDGLQQDSTSMNMNVTLRVLDVVMGQATIECTISDIEVNGRLAPPLQMTVVVDPTGRLIASDIPSEEPIARLILSAFSPSDLIGVQLPQQPVKRGSIWTVPKNDTITVEGATGAVYTTGNVEHMLTGVRDTFGITCWALESTVNNFEQRGRITAEGVDLDVSGFGTQSSDTYLEASTGMLMAQRQTLYLNSVTRPVNDELAKQVTLEVSTQVKINMQRRATR